MRAQVTGGFLSSVVAASALLLWLEPSRNWFDGVPASPDRAAGGGSTTQRASWPPPPPEQPAESPAPPTVSGPRPHQGFGTTPTPAVQGGASRPARRPAAVMWA